ncbi:MAG: CCA tRNA nucleotidyltransferase, partial [Thermoguttaceae bacterium]
PLLISEGIEDLLALLEAISVDGAAAAAYCREKLQWSPEKLNPPLLVTGDDLLKLGIPQGPAYGRLLQKVRDMQLDGKLSSPQEAKKFLEKER